MIRAESSAIISVISCLIPDSAIAEEQEPQPAGVNESPIRKMLNRRFEDHTKEFILKAQQRFEAMEKKRKNANNVNTISEPANVSADNLFAPAGFAARLRRHISSSPSDSADARRLQTRLHKLPASLQRLRRIADSPSVIN